MTERWCHYHIVVVQFVHIIRMLMFGAVVCALTTMKQTNKKTYRKFRVSTASVVEHNRPEQERMILRSQLCFMQALLFSEQNRTINSKALWSTLNFSHAYGISTYASVVKCHSQNNFHLCCTEVPMIMGSLIYVQCHVYL